MNKTRLEAFSDGVFAIAITLLVLNISVESVTKPHLAEGLKELLPKIFTYIMSFLLIGLYWIGHHFYSDRIKQVDGTFVLLNILFLLLISFLPFPTSLIGKYPLEALPLTLYGSTLLVTNIISFIMVTYLKNHPHLTHESFHDEFYRQQLPLFFWINLFYVIGIACAFVYPQASYIVYMLMLFFGIKMYVKRMNTMVKG
jgi:uncharacterized membrane protein